MKETRATKTTDLKESQKRTDEASDMNMMVLLYLRPPNNTTTQRTNQIESNIFASSNENENHTSGSEISTCTWKITQPRRREKHFLCVGSIEEFFDHF